MINDRIKERINNLKTKEEVENYIDRVKVSEAPLEQREEIIDFVKKIHFKLLGLSPEEIYSEIIEDIEASQADLDDIGGD